MNIFKESNMEKNCDAAEAVNTPYFKRLAK
jgi:hypothetical protein